MVRSLFLCAWAMCLAAACLALPAVAQLAPPAPVRQTVDANGVDMFNGVLDIGAPALTIGDTGTQGMTFQKLWRSNKWADSINAFINKSGSLFTVSIGGVSDSFNLSGTTYTGTEASGSTLTFSSGTGIYTYTQSNGTVWQFSKGRSSPTPYYSNEGRVSQVYFPTGEKRYYTYQQKNYCVNPDPCSPIGIAYRLSGVRNSYGYQLTFDYETDDIIDPGDEIRWSTLTSVQAINLANEYCNPADAPCSVSGSWPGQALYNFSAGSDTVYNVTNALGKVTSYRVSASGQLLGIKRPGSTSEDVTFGYASGKVASVTKVVDSSSTIITTYGYSDSAGVRTVTVTDPLSHTTVYRFDIAKQRMTRMTDPLGHETNWEYDANGRMTKAIQPELNYTQITYDGRGNVTETRAVPKTGTSAGDIVTSATYTSPCTNPATCNQPDTTTDALNKVTNYYYYFTGQISTVQLPAPTMAASRPLTYYCYSTALQAYFKKNDNTNIVASGDTVSRLVGTSTSLTTSDCTGSASDIITSVNYGPQTAGTANNLLPVSKSSGAGDGSLTATTTLTYDSIGNVLTSDGPLSGTGDTSYFHWDIARQFEGAVGPDPDGGGSLKRRAIHYTYDDKGRPILFERGTVNGTSGSDWTAFASLQSLVSTYDGIDRKLKNVFAGTSTTYSVTQYSYDAASNPTCTALRMNPATWSALPSSACTLATTGSAGPDRIEKRTYDNANRLTLVQSAFGVTTANGFPATQQRDLTAAAWTDNNRLLSVKDANNNLTSYVYDGFDRSKETHYPLPMTPNTSSPTDYEALTYDKNSNVTNVRLRDAQNIVLTYDDLNRLLSKTPGSETPVTYSYDISSRLTGATQSSYALTFAYDALSRLTQTTSPLGNVCNRYDLAGRRTRMGYPGANCDTPSGFYVDYDYLLTSEMIATRESGATSGVGVLATFAYDDLGRRTGVTRGNGTSSSYTFNTGSQFTGMGQTFPAESASNLTLGFSYNSASQITGATRSNDAYAYKGYWNTDRLYEINGLNQYTKAGTNMVTHDARGNINAIGTKSYGYSAENYLISGPGGVTLEYDPVGRLAKTASTALTSRRLYDGLNLIAEYDAAGTTMTKRYVFGPGTDEPIVSYVGSGIGSRSWLHADERGSIIAASNSSGAVTEFDSYDDYGNPADTNTQALGYTGQAWLADFGMWYYKARLYNPALGRFMQSDPIGYGGGMNLYAYVGGDPVNFRDPFGLEGDDIYSIGCQKGSPITIGGVPHCLADFATTDPFNFGGERNVRAEPGLIEQLGIPDLQPLACAVAGVIFQGGKGTAQVGLAGTGQAGPAAVTAGGGLAFDRYGNVGFYKFFGGGAGEGLYIGGGVSGQLSTADGIDNLNGAFLNTSGSGGLGEGFTADLFTGPSNAGPVVGGGATYGGGAGYGTFAGPTFTDVTPLFNIKSALGCGM